MKWHMAVAIVTVGIFVTAFGATAQQSWTSQDSPTARAEAKQNLLDSPLYQRAAAAGGKLIETRDADPSDLSEDLPSIFARSDEVLIVHLFTRYSGLSDSGDSVLAHYDVQVLRSWKGQHAVGEIVTMWVPVGGLLLPNGVQAVTSVSGFSGLQLGGRYLLFLHSSSSNAQTKPQLWLVGDGVQGAFMLQEEIVRPAYERGALWKAYNRRTVPALLEELDSLSAGRH
jgi:hypothetical protein